MRRSVQYSVAALVVVASAVAGDLWARGFGGFHGGGMHAGGFHPGGMAAGGFHPGGMGAGGFHPGGMGAGGFHAGGLGGGLHGLNPGAGGFGAANRFGGGLDGVNRVGGGGGGFGGDRVGANRFGGGGIAGGDRGRVGGGEFGGAPTRPPTRTSLNSFLGLPSDGGMHHVSRASAGWDATRGVARGPAGGVAAGGRVEGPRGGEAGRGVAVGPRGNMVGGRYARGPAGNAVGRGVAAGPRGMRSISAARLNDSAVAVRRNFHNYGLYNRDWYRRYPGAWYAAGWGAGYAWRAATWDSIDNWFAYEDVEPIYYDYGTNVVYQGDNVYVQGQDIGTAQQYYDQATELATDGTQAEAPADGDWLPLGVFALTKPDHSSANIDMQLAVNKAGIIRGNYTNTVTQETQPIHGSVDKQTQRAAWFVGNNKQNVIETGIDNLTKSEAPALLHLGADRSEQWMLVRIEPPDQNASTNGGSPGQP